MGMQLMIGEVEKISRRVGLRMNARIPFDLGKSRGTGE